MGDSGETWFDQERLEVYREAIAFAAWLSTVLDNTVRVGEVKDQLDRASTSIALNIAEGNGKFGPKDRCRCFDIAHGSALECAAGLDILVAKSKLTNADIRSSKDSLQKKACGCSWALSSATRHGSTKKFRQLPAMNHNLFLTPALNLLHNPNLHLNPNRI
jgi:four helix bundle protein